jgi:hypothetical protein
VVVRVPFQSSGKHLLIVGPTFRVAVPEGKKSAMNLELPGVANDDVLIACFDEVKSTGPYLLKQLLQRSIFADVGDFPSNDVSILG